jgi:predicted ATP-grasp superfamily ATP-dependent carboligase
LLSRQFEKGHRANDLPGRYYQQRIDGTACGAVYVAAGGRARLLGVTRQIVGARWAGATGFQYAGSIGPLLLPDACLEQFRRLGECLADRFRLRGLFGVDAILNAAAVWPIEVNPRYTASIEVLERALLIKAVEMHAAAFREGRLPGAIPTVADSGLWHGKAIVYAKQHVIAGECFAQHVVSGSKGPWPQYSDVPQPGTQIRAGQPILTVFAEGAREEHVEHHLKNRAEDVRKCLTVAPRNTRASGDAPP